VDVFDQPLPADHGYAVSDFDVRAYLGRKGTSFYDRATGLAVVACAEAMRDTGLDVAELAGTRTGLVLGTTVGSLRSISDYSRETLVQEKPYLVNPVLFPNTVMNCAAGQAAIRLGLRGVNATIAGGELAFVQAMRYAGNALDRGYADVMLIGAVEEYSAHRAWTHHLAGDRHPPVATGEGAGVLVAARADALPPGARHDGEILAVATAFGAGDALAGCVTRVLRRAGIDGADVDLVLTGESTPDSAQEYGPARRALGHDVPRLLVKRELGACDAATGALAAVGFLAGDTGGVALLTASTADGGVGAALVRRAPS
jgi:3-oxoacyl-[acyl-carrier-protein] synthase II